MYLLAWVHSQTEPKAGAANTGVSLFLELLKYETRRNKKSRQFPAGIFVSNP